MRVLADSSVWIAYLRGAGNPEAVVLDRAIRGHLVLLGDVILAEVLRGIADESMARKVAARFEAFETVSLCGTTVALAAAGNYRLLRSRGVTMRGTIDLIIGTWCILNDTPLIHGDRDFEGMERHLGLKRWTGRD